MNDQTPESLDSGVFFIELYLDIRNIDYITAQLLGVK